jgi:hypothetical protein
MTLGMSVGDWLFVVVMVVAVAGWLVTYRLIGGYFPPDFDSSPYQSWSGPYLAWGFRWRSLVAALVGAGLGYLVYELGRPLLP